jgi:hypothetical protein
VTANGPGWNVVDHGDWYPHSLVSLPPPSNRIPSLSQYLEPNHFGSLPLQEVDDPEDDNFLASGSSDSFDDEQDAVIPNEEVGWSPYRVHGNARANI